jgi:predicted transposase/invertase (TIGR01784 family)
MESFFERPFIPLISDYGFKATFGNEHNSLFLRQALQALIQSEVPIARVDFLPNEVHRLNPDSRGGVYDLACIDEQGQYFIVEMQLSEYPEFIQRMKFYSLYRFNTLIKRGDYSFANLPRIYCIGIMGSVMFPDIAGYYNVVTLRNQSGELMDDQTTFVTVELPKFTTPATAIVTDLDKLLYTMKTLHEAPANSAEWPFFWTEEWLKTAMEELDRRNMDPEELLQFEMTLARNAHIMYNAKRQMEKATSDGLAKGIEQGIEKGMEQGIEKGMEQGMQRANTETVKNLLQMGILSAEQIAKAANVTLDFVLAVQANQ